MDKPKVNVALIGSGFMARAHSNGLRQVNAFFDLPVEPVLQVLAARNVETGGRIADKFGWHELAPDWRAVIDRPDIAIVDIVTPVHTHAEIALAALRAGKAVICEKPLAASLSQAMEMAQTADKTGSPNMCNYNLRATPAIAYARQLIQEGALGRINQWRAAAQQGWLVDPDFPLTWRLRKETAGSGALGDLGSHSIDLARFLVGEIQSVNGLLHTFTKERWIPVKDQGRNSIPTERKGQVTVDDSVWSMLRFQNGALGSMEATRMASGQLSANRFEMYGALGALEFNFERMNELRYFSSRDPRPQQGWRTIHVTQPVHPYTAAWWPAGHSLGYEHTFTHMLADFFRAYERGESPAADFRDAARTQAVLQAIERSDAARGWVEVETRLVKEK